MTKKKQTRKKQTRKKPTSTAKKAPVKKPKPATKPGRPTGSRNKQLPVAEQQLSRCHGCSSTEKKSTGQSPVIQEYSGVYDGKPYTHIIRRRVVCTDCGQHRMDRNYENRVSGSKN